MKKGITAGVVAYLLWGFFPLFFNPLLKELSPLYVLSSRFIFSFIICVLLIFIFKEKSVLQETFKDKKKTFFIALASIFLATNWYTFIWAVGKGMVIDTSMGYFINPLLSILVSALIFKEKLLKMQWFALLIAFIGVMNMLINYGKVPYIALIIAVSFCTYGALKKAFPCTPIGSLTIETLTLLPLGLIIMFINEKNHTGAIGNIDFTTTVLLLLVGVMTIAPLLLFSYAVGNIPLNLVGFIQYLTPTITFFLSLFVFKEELSMDKLVTFIFIWIALIIFTTSKVIEEKKKRVAHHT